MGDIAIQIQDVLGAFGWNVSLRAINSAMGLATAAGLLGGGGAAYRRYQRPGPGTVVVKETSGTAIQRAVTADRRERKIEELEKRLEKLEEREP